jgi:hypothetical protein
MHLARRSIEKCAAARNIYCHQPKGLLAANLK